MAPERLDVVDVNDLIAALGTPVLSTPWLTSVRTATGALLSVQSREDEIEAFIIGGKVSLQTSYSMLVVSYILLVYTRCLVPSRDTCLQYPQLSRSTRLTMLVRGYP